MDGGKKAKYMVYTEQVWPANSDKLLIKTELKWLVMEFYFKKKKTISIQTKASALFNFIRWQIRCSIHLGTCLKYILRTLTLSKEEADILTQKSL